MKRILISVLACYSLTSYAFDTYVKCTASNCPSLPKAPTTFVENQAIIFETAKDNPKQFLRQFSKSFTIGEKQSSHTITVNTHASAHTHPIIGFGGSFTDSAAMLYIAMTPSLQKKFIAAYYSDEGADYSLGRVPIASTDFSCRTIDKHGRITPTLGKCSPRLSQYSYADRGDLNHFSLQIEDEHYRIPMIQAALLTHHRSQPHQPLKLFASAWSAPAWMKSNNSMINGRLNPINQQDYADYLVKFFTAYQKEHIKFWGVTVQNEPVESIVAKFIDWQSMFFTQDEEAIFIKNHLGPTLAKFAESYGQKINIMMHDDQITSIHTRTRMLEDPKVAQYIAGAGFHWYLNNAMFYKNLDQAYQHLNPEPNSTSRFILGTEACAGYIPINKGPSLGNWSRAEAYAKDIIQDLNHHVSGWTDWNLVLDMQGGPNWVGNLTDAPILVDLSKQTFYKQPLYFYLAHFSKFIRPGAEILRTASNGFAALEVVSVRAPASNAQAETVTVVVLNHDLWHKDYVLVDVSGKEKKYIELVSPGRSIQTIIYRN